MMTYQYQLVADIMADLTGRFGDLTQVSINQHLPQNIDPGLTRDMIGEIRHTLALAEAAEVIAQPPRIGAEAGSW